MNSYQCQLCFLACKDIRSLSQHIRRKHQSTISKDYYDKYLKKIGDGICYCGELTCYKGLSGYDKYCSKKCLANSDEVKYKRSITNQRKYGGCSPYHSKEIQEKGKNTTILNHGIENVFKDVNKIKHSYIEKLGVVNPSQLDVVKRKKRDTWLKHYGYDHYSKSIEGRINHRLHRISSVETQKLNGEPLMPNIGSKERECLNVLQNYTKYLIIRNDQTIGHLTGCFPDGYIKELNLVIEFDENFHYINGLLSKNDIDRQQILIDQIQCKIFRIKQSDWLNRKDDIIILFQQEVA